MLKKDLLDTCRSGRRSGARGRFQSLEARQLLAASPVTADLLVNQFTAGEQSLFLAHPSTVAVNDQGDAVTVWASRDQDGDGWGVYGRRVAANGSFLGSEFLINQTTAGDQWRPSVAMDADGDFVVVWQQGVDLSDGGRVFGRRYNSAGQPVSPEFRVSESDNGNEVSPVVGCDRHGNFAVVWKSDASFPLFGIIGRRFNAAGIPLADPFSVRTGDPVADTGSVSLSDDGTLLVVWLNFTFDVDYDAAARMFGPDGAPLGPEFAPTDYRPGRQDQISATFTRNGQFAIVWAGQGADDDVGIYARVFAADRTPLTAPFLVNTYTVNMQVIPSISADAAGNFTIVFTGDGGPLPAPFRRKYSPAGVPLTNVETVTSDPVGFQGNGGVAVEPDGNLIVNWDDSSTFFGRPGDIFVRRFAEPADAAPPTVAGVYLVGDPGSLLGSLPAPAGAPGGVSPTAASLVADGAASETIDLAGAYTMRSRTWSDRFRQSGIEPLESRQLLAVTPLTNDVLVNSTTAGLQSLFLAPRSTLAVDDQGDAVTVWSSLDQDGDGWGVYGRRIAADGSPLGDEFRLSIKTVGDQRFPSVALDADGDFVVAWQDGSSYDPEPRVLVRRFRADGTPLGDEFRVSDFASSREQRPVVGSDRAGNFLVLWQGEGTFPLGGLLGRRFNAAGQPLGDVFELSAGLNPGEIGGVTFDESGRFLVSWSAGAGETDSEVYVRPFAADGTPLGPPQVANDEVAGGQGQVHATFTTGGQYVVVWAGFGSADDIGVYARRFAADGTPQGASFLVNTWTINSQVIPSVAADAAGNFTVLWSGDGANDGSGTYARSYAANGQALSDPFLVNLGTEPFQGDGNLALERDGNLIANWHARALDGSEPGDIYLRRFVAGADTASPQVVVSSLVGEPASLDLAPTRGVATSQLVISFTEALSTAGGTGGAQSASNRANYALSRNGVDISAQITGVSFGYDATLRRQLATLELAAPLTDGNYVLTAQATLRDLAGNALDGDRNGTPGGNFTQAFTIAAPPAATSPGQVNATVGDDQVTRSGGHALASDADGDTVVVWTSFNQDGSGWGVYGQRYDAAGATVGSEFRVPTVITGDQLDPAVASDADGDFVVVWSSAGQDGSGAGVYAQRYNAAGTAQGAAFRVNVTTQGQQRRPDVALDAAGRFAVAWTSLDQDGGGEGVYFRRYTATGVPAGSEQLVNVATAGDQIEPSIAALPGGGWGIAWTTGAGSERDVAARTFAADGTPVTGELVVTSSAGLQQQPVIAGSPTGEFAVAWVTAGPSQTEQVWLRRFAAEGTPSTDAIAVESLLSRTQTQPALVWASTGELTAGWTGNEPEGTSTDVWARRFDAATNPLGPAFVVGALAGEQKSLGLAATKSGALVAAWTQNTGGTADDVFVRRYAGAVDTQGPRPSGLFRAGDSLPLAAGTSLPDGVGQLVIAFDENLVAGAGPVFAAGSVRNLQNWRLEKDGSDASATLAGVAFGLSPTSGHYEATLTFTAPLANGQYRLVAEDAILDLAGNRLDGDQDGVAGGDAQWDFAVAPGLAIGAEIRVNTVTAGDQTTQGGGGQNVARNAAGDAVAVWSSQGEDGSGWGVYAQRFAPNATAVGGAILVTVTTALDQREPAVALAENGTFVVAWTSSGQDGSGRGVYARRFSAAGAPLTGEILVPQTTTGDQGSPAVGSDPVGNFLVAWTSTGQDAAGDEVYARRFSATGAPWAGEFRVNTTLADDQQLPSVAVDAYGNALVAWNSRNQDGSGWGVYGRRLNSDGRAMTNEFRVNQATAGDQSQARAAVALDGTFAVAWASAGQDASGTAVMARRYRAVATPLGNEVVVNTTSAGNQQRPGLAFDELNDLTVAWTSGGQDGDAGGIYLRRISATGAFLSGEEHLAVTNSGDQDFVTLTADGPGRVLAVWTSTPQDGSGSGVYLRRMKPNEVPTTTGFDPVAVLEDSPPVVIELSTAFADSDDSPSQLVYSLSGNSNPGLFTLLTIDTATARLTLNFAANTRGQATLVVRATDTQGFFVETPLAVTVAAVTDLAGQSLGPPLLISTPPSSVSQQDTPSTSLDHDAAGNFVVVWANSTGGFNQIYGRRFSPAGTPLGDPFPISPAASVAVAFPDVALRGDGQFIATWSVSASGAFDDLDVFARRFAADGTPLGEAFLVNQTTAQTQGFSQVAVDADGDFVITWTSGVIQSGGAPEGLNTYLRRYNAAGQPLGGEVPISLEPAQLRGFSQVGMTPTGDFVIGYSEGFLVLDDDDKVVVAEVGIWVRRFNPQGVQVGAPILVSQDSGPSNAGLFAALAVADDGAFSVAWVRGSLAGLPSETTETVARRFDAAGVPLSDQFVVGGVIGEPVPIGVAVDHLGGLTVVARSSLEATPSGVWFRRFDAAGAGLPLTRLHTVPEVLETGPAVTALPDGRLAFAWAASETEVGGSGIYVRVFDVTVPRVVGLSVRNAGGTAWIPAAGSGAQLKSVPLVGVNAISLVFSESVLVQAADLEVTGLQVAQYAFSGFSYDPATYTATWTLATPASNDRLTLRLNADGTGPVRDAAGNRLDGEWDNPTSLTDPSSSQFPSGSGVLGGNFVFQLNVLAGDANGDGSVGAGDYAVWSAQFGQTGSRSGDFDGNGSVGAADYSIWAARFGSSLPLAPGAAASASASIQPPASSRQGGPTALAVNPYRAGDPAPVEAARTRRAHAQVLATWDPAAADQTADLIAELRSRRGRRGT